MIIDFMHFDIVSGCQLLCVGCPSAGLQRHVTMIEPSYYRTCLNNIDVENIRLFRPFNYGEPLLHRQLPDVLRVLLDFRLHRVPIDFVEMSTNAQYVNWDHLEEVLRMGVLDRLVVSCDGDGTAESFERLRPPARWEKLIEFLERVGEFKARENLPLDLMTRTIVETLADCERWNAVLMPRGWRPEFRRWKYLSDAPQNMTGRAFTPGVGICLYVEPVGKLFVDADGSVVPCCAHPRASVLGNLGNETYSSILRGERRAAFVRSLQEHRRDMSVCGNCEFGPIDNPGPSAMAADGPPTA